MTFSPLASPSATRAALERYGLATKKRLGQHFLVDDNVIGRILSLADLRGTEVALEIGPGLGTLTIALCARVRHVVAVERDADLLPALAEVASECGNVSLVEADAVTVDRSQITGATGEPEVLVANLPYGVAATVILRMFEMLPGLEAAVVMVQSEVADRIFAVPGTKQYGAYTVKLRLLAETIGRFQVPRTCFLPPPRVDSAVMRLQRRPLSDDSEALRHAAAAADASFAHRRKTIRNSLKTALGATSEAIELALEEAGISGDARAETLLPDAFILLGESLKSAHLLRV